MARCSMVYDAGGKLLEVGTAGKKWGSPDALKKLTVKEVELTLEQRGALESVAVGNGGDGITKSGAMLYMEAVAASKDAQDALISAAIAEVLKIKMVADG
jgi:hypothetical protein